jgi:Mg-chelatase subunit ChlI-like protein
VLARLATAALVGLTAHPVGVEVDIGRGLPAVTVVGLGGTAVLEARDRLRAAFGNTGYEWPDRRITVSLPPADLPKQGSGFDGSNVKPVRAKIWPRRPCPRQGDHGDGTAQGCHLLPHQP